MSGEGLRLMFHFLASRLAMADAILTTFRSLREFAVGVMLLRAWRPW